MILTILSDTHNRPPPPRSLPPGDVLVHCGDFTASGTEAEFENFSRWLAATDFEEIVLTYGNHDWLGEENRIVADYTLRKWCPDKSVHVLVDEGVTLDGVKFWGAPWQPAFHDWAFNLPRGVPLRERWALIPEDTDVLITHGPPAGILDRTERGDEVGCVDLANRVFAIEPQVHAFGHIHEGAGERVRWGVERDTRFINAAYLDERYRPRDSSRWPAAMTVEVRNAVD